MTSDSEESSSNRGRRSKVARVIGERDLDGLGAELERRWSGDGEQSDSLRDLAEYFNRRVLEATMRDADLDVLDGEAENLYGLLTGDDVTAGTRVQAERRLERAGIDVDCVRADFATHQAIHTYLRNHRGVPSPDRRSSDSPEDHLEMIEQLRSRAQAVTRTSLESLERSGELDVGDVEVFVDVRVTCTDCETQYTVGDLVETGSCQCS